MYLLDAAGILEPRGRLDTLPDDYEGRRWAAHLQADHAGRFLYVSNRAHDSLAVFAIDGDPEAPLLVERLPSGGQTPRHFSLSPDGRFLLVAHQDSGQPGALRRRPDQWPPHAPGRVACGILALFRQFRGVAPGNLTVTALS